MSATPRFSVLVPVYDPPTAVLSETLQSVLDQTFPDWELVAVDDHSPREEVRTVLRDVAARDPRVRVVERATNGHIVAASNDALAAARGEFVVLLDHDDLLAPDALATVAEAVAAHPGVDYLYSDEDKVADDGGRYGTFLKPDWSPERLRHQMYTGHLSVLRTATCREVGGFTEGSDGSQDHDLVLKVTERGGEVVHVPRVLYHWRVGAGSTAGDNTAKPYAWIAGQAAVQRHVDRVGIEATVQLGRLPGAYVLDRVADPSRPVSIVIPTRGDAGRVWGVMRTYVVEAVRSALAHTSLPHVEVVVVHDLVTPPAVLAELRAVAGNRLTLVPYAKAFNFSEKCNLGVLASRGADVVLLNDDVEVITDHWLEQLVAPLRESDVGITGAHLLLEDGTVQHAGLTFANSGWHHPYHGTPDGEEGDFRDLWVNREVSGLTAACVAMRRDVFDDVGGLCEDLPINFNDVDLSSKVRLTGHRAVWMAGVKLFHFESKTRSPVVFESEVRFMEDRWGGSDRDAFLPTR